MKELREYQTKNSILGASILKELNIVYYAMQVRTGKTATALNTCKINGYKKVLFLTKKKAIDNIIQDYIDFGFTQDFELIVLNNESLHLLKDNDFDCVVMDEAHRFGSFPKPAKMAKDFKLRFANKPIIFLTGTPTPESYSQIYHQLWVSNFNPFKEQNFYKWANNYVDIQLKYIAYGTCKDYSNAKNDIIKPIIDKYLITFTQEQAGFQSKVNENILYCEMNKFTYQLIDKLKKDLVIQGKDEIILADTGVKLMNKIYQISNGHVIFESGNSKILDDTKARFIKERFKDKKIAIFYKFKNDYMVLKSVYGDLLTNDLDVFNATKKNIAYQFIKGREGISLKNADCLIFYTLDFSATTYFQARDRMLTKDRLENDVFFIFTKGGMEDYIYKSLKNKKKYTLSIFKKDYGISK